MQIDPTLRALADPTRLRIMRLLTAMELAVGELAQVLGQSQPRVSRHVKILCDAGLARRRKEGSWVFLNSAITEDRDLSVPTLGGATTRLLSAAERDDAVFAQRCEEDRRHLAAIRGARESSAAAYFARHAEQWDEMRKLLSDDAPVEQALQAALLDGPVGVMLDVGTGTGRMAELFSPHASHVTAFDKSPEMLRIARARLQHLPNASVTLVQGDFTDLPFSAAAFDTVLFHQVLHYAQAPELVLAQAARVTRPDGRIAVVDLAAHDHEDMRSVHAHARLGFTDGQMADLFTAAGFTPASPIALPGGQLTVKIWTGHRKGQPDSTPAPA